MKGGGGEGRIGGEGCRVRREGEGAVAEGLGSEVWYLSG